MKWTIVAFRHPDQSHTLLYRQNLSPEKLLEAVEQAIEKGANLMSLRGFED